MRFSIMICFAFCILNFTLTCSAQDKIVAVVNDDIITQKDLNDFINFMRIQLSAQYRGKDLENKIQSMKLDLLDRLIEDRLILQEAKKNKLQVDVNVVKGKMNEIKKHYSSDAEFTDVLRKQGLVSADIEIKTKEQLLMHNIIEIKVKRNISVNPGEVTNFYSENIEKFKLLQQREFESAAIGDEKIANVVFNNLNDGKPMDGLAKTYSFTVNKVTAMQGGQLRKDIEDRVFSLNLGEISKPLRVQEVYYIFKLINVIPGRQQALAEVQDKIYTLLVNDKMQEELTRWIDQLKKSSYIKIIEQGTPF